MLPFFISNKRYKVIGKISSGSYGYVYKAIDLENHGKEVAVKQVSKVFENYGDINGIRMIRELYFLKHLKNGENIVKIKDISYDEKNVYIVMEYLEKDVVEYINECSGNENDYKKKEEVIKNIMYQLCVGVFWIHSSKLIHRDLKPMNLMIGQNGSLKIIDFGLTRERFIKKKIDGITDNSFYFASRNFRAPEQLLLWEKAIGYNIDVWAIGCIFAELLEGHVFFDDTKDKSAGNDYLNQLQSIINILGTPKEKDIKSCVKGRSYIKRLKEKEKQDFKILFKNYSKEAINLLEKMLKFNPNRRITIKNSLSHAFFKTVRRSYQREKKNKPFNMDLTSKFLKSRCDVKVLIDEFIKDWKEKGKE